MSEDLVAILNGENAQVRNEDEGRAGVDIFETDEKIFVVAPLAGTAHGDIEISVSEDLLTIRGSRNFPEKLPAPRAFILQECFWGKFSRSIVLPCEINGNSVKAKIKHNVLVIAMEKKKSKNEKKIKVEI